MPCTNSRAAILKSPRNRSCRRLPSPAPIRISPRRRRTARATTRPRWGSRLFMIGAIRRILSISLRSSAASRRAIRSSSTSRSYPTETVGIARAANEIGLKTKLFGGGMVGLQYASIKTQLGELLNRIVDYDFYVPEPTVLFKGIEGFLARYQAKAPSIGADLLGYFIPPFAYANGQVLEQAVAAV